MIKSAAPIVLLTFLTIVAALYAWLCIKRIKHAEAFELVLAADGHLSLENGRSLKQIEAVRWQDFGYLAVLHCRADEKPAVYFWWRHFLTSEQRRVLRRIMNAATIEKLEKSLNLTVNPLL